MATGYLTLLSLDEQLRVTRATLKAREEALQLARRQYETGYTSRLELMQSDSELRATRAQVPVLQHQIHQQENALSLLLGRNPGAIARSAFAGLTPLTPAFAATVNPAEPTTGHRPGAAPVGCRRRNAGVIAGEITALDQSDRVRQYAGRYAARSAR